MHPDGRESYLGSSLFFCLFFLSGTGVKIRMRERERDRSLTGLTLSGLKTRSILDLLRRFADTGFLSSSVENEAKSMFGCWLVGLILSCSTC